MAAKSKQAASKKTATKKKKTSGAAKSQGGFARGLSRLGSIFGGWFTGRELDESQSSHLREVQGVLLVGFSVWLGLSLFSFYTPYSDVEAAGRNWGGRLGHYLAELVLISIGWSGYLLSFLGLAWGAVMIAGREVAFPLLRLFGGVCFLVACAALAQLGLGESFVERIGPGRPGANTLPYGPGGWLALELIGPSPNARADHGPLLIETFGRPGLWILLTLISLSSFTLATERAFYPALTAFGEWLRERRDEQDEGLLTAIGGFTKRLASRWWHFLSGADLVGSMALADGTALEEAPLKAKAKAQAKPKAKPKKAKAKPEPEEDEEWEEEAEYDDESDEAGEWEYEDEEGEEEEGEWEDDEDPDAEWEDEEGDEEEEWEEVDEVELEPTPAISDAKRKAAKAKLMKSIAAQAPKDLVYDPPTPPPGPWKFPPLSLLQPPDAVSSSGGKDAETIEKEADRLENVLASFRVDAQVVASTIGPAVTMYELEVASGVRMSKVTTLSQEIAAALRAKSIRIIAPIPGKATIGIEVPNANRRVVRFSELIHKKAYDKKFAALPLFLGMDAEGGAIVEDLAKMPHLLIAGQTGAGKSVCINTIICSLLLTRSPHDVQMIMIDPKMVELAMYNDVPHQMAPVVTDMKQATRVLEWAVEKMEGRYELFKDAGVRNIKGYNALGEKGLREKMGDDFNEERTPRHVPYIVVIIDELADLMMISKKEAEQAITRLAQKSRAVGIHVIVATQRPSTDVITGVLKANLPTRIAFTVASKIDSRVILDAMGAEKLLGFGDMLYNPPQSSTLKRVQGALVEDHELDAVVEFVTKDSAPNFSQELIQTVSGDRNVDDGSPEDFAARDDMWDQAVRVVLKTKRGSASLLQRALGIGYTRASRLIDMMGEAGIVGEHKGSKSRELLLTLEDWEEMHGAEVGSGASDD